MGCCCPENLAYSWSIAFSLSYRADLNFNSYPLPTIGSPWYGLGKKPLRYQIYPPLLGTGGTIVPKQGDWVFLCQTSKRGYGILADGSLWGWGDGPLGDGTSDGSIFPKKISSGPWRKVSASDTHTVALKGDGTIWAWGYTGCAGDDTAYDVVDYLPPYNSPGLSNVRAVINSSIVSLRTIDLSIFLYRWNLPFLSSLQPSSVNIVTDGYGSGAAVSCVLWYQLVFDDGEQLYHYIGRNNSYYSPPTFTVTPDPRDTNARSATFEATLSEEGFIRSIRCTYSGEYTQQPSVTMNGTLTDGTSFSQPLVFGMSLIRSSLNLLSGGSEYSHRITSPISVTLTMPPGFDQQTYTAAYANLSESPVVRIDQVPKTSTALCGNGRLYGISCVIQYSYSRYVGNSSFYTEDFSSVVPQATLVSYDDEDIALQVVPVGAASGAWKVVEPKSPPVRRYPGYIRVTWPSFTTKQVSSGRGGSIFTPLTPSPPRPDSYPASYELPFNFVDGTPSPYCESGNWTAADSIAGGVLFTCNSPTFETYLPYEQDPYWQSIVGDASGGSGIYGVQPYQYGPPIHPLKQIIAWGKTTSDNFYSPEYTYARTLPEYTEWVKCPVSSHYRPQTPPPVSLSIYSNNVGGAGLSVSSRWDFVGTNKSVDAYSLSYQVTNSGSGYIYEPTVFPSLEVLSPKQVGSRSDWTDVCCKSFQTSGIADGWPYSWGDGSRRSGSPPVAVGFGLNVDYSSTGSLFNNNNRFYSQAAFFSSAIRPHTAGVLALPPFSGAGAGTPLSLRSSLATNAPSGNINVTATVLPRVVDVGVPVYSFAYIYLRAASAKCLGYSRGIYDASQAEIPSSAKALLPEGFFGYSHFIPFRYSRDLLEPIVLKNRPQKSSIYSLPGACFTASLGDIGGGLTATLDAPSSFRRLFYHNNNLYALTGGNDLWQLSGSKSFTAEACGPLSGDDKIPLKVWRAELDVTWSWKVDKTDVTLLSGINPRNSSSIGSFQNSYLLPPEKQVNGDEGYVEIASVYPATRYKIVITDPGTGYKPEDSLTFTLKNAECVALSEKLYSFKYASHSLGTTNVSVAAVTGGNWNDTNHAWYGSYEGMTYFVRPTRVTLRRLPHPKAYVGNFGSTPSLSEESTTASYLKSITFHLSAGIDYSTKRLPNYFVGEWPHFLSYCVRGGGVYLKDSTYSNVTVNAIDTTTLGADANAPFFTRIPDVEISGGSGSGAKAILVPAFDSAIADGFSEQPQTLFRPFRISEGFANLGIPLGGCSTKYGITSGGRLRGHANPLADVPDSYASGFQKLDGSVGLTSRGDAYCINYWDGDLCRPAAFPNVEYRIDDGGSRYTMWPLVTVTQPSPDVAVVDAILDGKLVSLGVDEVGHGYTSPPSLTLSGGGGTGAEAVAVISGPIRDITLANGGRGFKAPPDVVFARQGVRAKATATVSGSVSEIVVADGGDGYKETPSVVITGSDGSGAAADAVMLQRVAFVRITARSGLFKSPPSVSFVGGGASEPAEAEAVCEYNSALNRYFVVSIRVTYKGQGYSSTPEVRVSTETNKDGSVSAVYAAADMDQYVSSLRIKSGGQGYSSPPSVLMFGQSNSQAKAFAMLSMSVVDVSLTSPGQYREAPSVAFTPKGTLHSVSLTSGGSGYKTTPKVIVVDTRGLGDGGGASCRINRRGEVTEVVVTSVGSGYDAGYPPSVLFVGGGGSGAEAVAAIEAAGSGASASCRLNASILYAKVTSPGSGYQFSPKVTISGGGNIDVADAESRFMNGDISSEEMERIVREAKGRIQSRIEGPISRFEIINPGNYYCKMKNDTTEYRYYGNYSLPPDLRQVSSWAQVVGGNRRTGVVFEATTAYPGGPISAPLTMPSTKFFQKPKVVFANSQDVDVQDFKQAKRTSAGVRSKLTISASRAFNEKGYSGLSPRLTNNLIFSWVDPVTGATRTGWSGILFEQDKFPEVIFNSESGSGMQASATLTDSGSVQSVSISSSGEGYSSRTTIDVSGGVLRHRPCVASCVVSPSGEVVSISVNNGGSGYFYPAVIIHDGLGDGALAEAVCSGGVIQSISVTAKGSGYSSDTPPRVLVYETAGYFSESRVGESFRAGLLNAFSQITASQYPLAWDFYQTEYAPPISHKDVQDLVLWSWPGISEPSGNTDLFGYLDEATNMTCMALFQSGSLSGVPYSSPPVVTVRGDCDSPMFVSSQVVRWRDIFSSNVLLNNLPSVCGIKDET